MAPITTVYYKQRLSERDQKICEELMYKWMHYETDIVIDKPDCEFGDIVSAIHDDIPLMFYLNYYTIPYSYTADKIYPKLNYCFEKEEAKALLSDCYKWGEFFVNKMPPNLTEPQKALWLHDVIVSNVKYGNNDSIRSHCIIGVIKDKVAVCEGIARTYKFLCDQCGIPCIYVHGILDGENHGWNVVWINGNPSFVDVTNDLRSGNTEAARRHFLRNSEEMHGYSWDENVVPKCTLRNLLDISVVAHNRNDILNLAHRIPEGGSISIYLDYGRKISAGEMDLLTDRFVEGMAHSDPFYLLDKEISYSPATSTIFIRYKH